jgi:hypothetical protein
LFLLRHCRGVSGGEGLVAQQVELDRDSATVYPPQHFLIAQLVEVTANGLGDNS